VLSIPSGHVYVRHLSPPEERDEVVRLPDQPVPGDVPAAQWWPPPPLEAAWVHAHQNDFDLAHLHFGFDARTPDQLMAWVTALRECGKPLVYTVHDLRNPHHLDSRLHDSQLDVLIPAADELVTLTQGAADVVERGWGRRAVVLPHPHVVPQDLLGAPRLEREDVVVGVHLKSLRASMDPLPVVETLVKVTPDLPRARLRIDVHNDVMTAGTPRHDPQVVESLEAWSAEGAIQLEVHDYFSDDELWDYFLGLDVSVLPYRFGTHSGWLEACFDLGTTVLVSDCGFYREQRPCFTYRHGPDGPDRPRLESELRRAYEERPRAGADREARLRERAEVARAHLALYRGALGR
jgi:hypothetical protein